jgi:subtilisin family serine protease
MANWMKRTLGKTPWRALPLLALGTLAAYQSASSFAGAAAKEPREKVEAAVLAKAARGETTFWVLLHEKASLAPALAMKREDARGEFVYRELREVADRSQADLRGELAARGARFQPFWVANTIRVTGDESLLLDIAARPEVKAVLDQRTYHIPMPRFEEAQAPNAIEWGIESIRAQKVWSEFGVRGEDIVVANIDTGVQYNNPALVRQYRGNLGGGNFDHNFDWEDPSNVCGNPSNVPCDSSGHGTHTMGTMVGDDGQPGPNQIGVAPNAKWIACMGCETGSSCSDFALLTCGQWVLAPTDLAGNNPSPALRPHVVNNSWAGGGGDPWYATTVNAWVASGIFPAFAAGNSGPACGSVDSPGDYVASYAAGAFNRSRVIASFSTRGPSAFGGELKPNVAAPGVSVRSSLPPNTYGFGTGTSMASPHVSGAVALLWSAAPNVRRDITATRLLLDNGAKDKSDLTCGGTADDNNVWGEGLLDTLSPIREALQR